MYDCARSRNESEISVLSYNYLLDLRTFGRDEEKHTKYHS
jgi:hypothetical protein